MMIVAASTLPERARDADFSFRIDDRLVPPFSELETEPVVPMRKDYGLDDALFHPRDGRDTALFVAEADGAIAGYVALSRGWTGCAEIDDIATARQYRRRGVAIALLDRASAWARGARLPALRLETQSTNVAACRLYAGYGFVLGGYDERLYRELGDAVAADVALFWYLTLRPDS